MLAERRKQRRVREWEAMELERKNKASDALYFFQKEEGQKMLERRMAENRAELTKQAGRARSRPTSPDLARSRLS